MPTCGGRIRGCPYSPAKAPKAELVRAEMAFLTFEKAWNVFGERFAAQAGFDAEKKEDLANMGKAVEETRSALMDNANGLAAHEALERVRVIFLESRTRQKIPYFLDFLSLFQNSMKGLLPQAGLASKAAATHLAQWQAKGTRSPAGVGLSLRKIRDFAIINIEYPDV